MTASGATDRDRQAIVDALGRHEVKYLVIRAAAAEALGWSGRSEDIDIVPESSEANLGCLATALDQLDANDPASPDGLAISSAAQSTG